MNFKKLADFMDLLTLTKVPGNAVTVYYKGKKVFSYASGFSDIEHRIPMTGKELLNIYSCSKLATVTAACQLLERGIFVLSDPLYEYIPEYKEMFVDTPGCGLIKAKNPITIGDLFSMTAGFRYSMDTPEFDQARKITNGSMDTLETIKCLAKAPLCFEPGTKWRYSLCHDVLAGVVSVVTGQKFRDYVRLNIFEPLEMNSTFYHRTEEIEQQMAQQYSFMPQDSQDFNAVEAQQSGYKTKTGYIKNVGKSAGIFVPGPEYDSGGAGLVSSVPDYAKLIAALANEGVGINGQRILSSRMVKLMRTDRLNDLTRSSFNWNQLRGYGYGLGVRTMIHPQLNGSLSPVGEFGWSGAAGSTAIADTENRLAVFYSHHMLNPQETYYLPRLINTVYACLDD